jgi:hypothetical protein
VRLLGPPGVAAVGAGRQPDPVSDRVQRRCLSKQQSGVSVAPRSTQKAWSRTAECRVQAKPVARSFDARDRTRECRGEWTAQTEPAIGRQRSTSRLQGRTVSTVGNPAVDPDAFDAFEAAGWEEKAVAYERFFGVITDRVVAPLLAAASVGVGTRVLDVATGPGWVAARAAERGASWWASTSRRR